MIFLTVALVAALAVIAYQQFSFSRALEGAREEAVAERRELLQRIQDPQTANAMQAQDQLDVQVYRHHMKWDDDEDYEQYEKAMDSQ